MFSIKSEVERSLECVLRIAAADPDKQALEYLAKEIAPLITSGPQGVTGYTSGRPHIREVFGYWPCLINHQFVSPEVKFLRFIMTQPTEQILRDMAYARSGDKGSKANIGVIAYDVKGYEYLVEHLTADVVLNYFNP